MPTYNRDREATRGCQRARSGNHTSVSSQTGRDLAGNYPDTMIYVHGMKNTGAAPKGYQRAEAS